MERSNSATKTSPAFARSPVTELEREALLGLESELLGDSKGVFYCKGKLEDLGVQEPRIYYTVGGGSEGAAERASVLHMLAGNSMGTVALHESCKASHFGVGDKEVMDETYRTARDLPSEQFATNFDPIHPDYGVLDRVSTAILNPVKAVRYKLNSYVTGGFFKSHKDTPKAENHVGTLLFGIPFPFTGGELLLQHGGRIVTIDWSKAQGVSWVFFYSDIEHQILPVTSGHRITIAYDVYSVPGSSKLVTDLAQLGVDLTALPLFTTFERNIFKNAEFRPQGCRLAFPLRYKYPLAEEGWTSNFASTLKGEDAILLKTLQHFHLETRLVAVYEVEEDEDDDDDDYEDDDMSVQQEKKGPIDEFSPYSKHTSRFFISDSFKGIRGNYVDQLEAVALRSQLGAKLETDIIWCAEPGSFVQASTYIAYGNEPSAGVSYVAAAIIAIIPAVGTGARVV